MGNNRKLLRSTPLAYYARKPSAKRLALMVPNLRVLCRLNGDEGLGGQKKEGWEEGSIFGRELSLSGWPRPGDINPQREAENQTDLLTQA